ncbi:MAG: dipeptide epimerase, partial [Acidobacteria bacterium]|nr:dipeptide epimerase [Acidobacteriota bacterium]
MRRRDWLAAAGGAPLARTAPPAKIETEVVRLNLRHTWTTVMSSSQYRDNLHLRYSAGGATGHGEGAPIPRYQEDARSAEQAVGSLAGLLRSADPWQFAKVMAQVFQRLEGQYAAKAAIDIALVDWVTQKLGIPLYRYFGLDPKDAPLTTFSIGIDSPEMTRQKVREAEEFPVLKVKVGLASNEATLEAVRSVTRKPLRVDANEGWKDPEEAARKIRWLESQGVELIEQPLPAAMLDEARRLRSRVNMPIFADEAARRPSDIPKLAGAYDGINVKLMKCGGILEAMRMIQVARSLGMKVMLGCMIESSVGITAAAHL